MKASLLPCGVDQRGPTWYVAHKLPSLVALAAGSVGNSGSQGNPVTILHTTTTKSKSPHQIFQKKIVDY